MNKNILKKYRLVIIMALLVVFLAIIAIMTLRYPKKIKQMFIQSSMDSMEKQLNDSSVYINDNVEMNYEEIKLLATLLAHDLDGTGNYSKEVLNTMTDTMNGAGFTNIGIMKNGERNLFATMSDGKKVQLDTWVVDLEYDKNEVSVEFQTSPFQSLDDGRDAVVYRYTFSIPSGESYTLVAEKPQESLNSILNVKSVEDGLIMVIRKNGNVVYGQGKIDKYSIDRYNIYAMLGELGADNDSIVDIKNQIENNETGRFSLNVNGQTYYFMSHQIKNTEWICVNAYSENVMAGENLSKVNYETLKLVIIVSAVLIMALLISLLYVRNTMKKQSEQKALETERLFEEMSRHIPTAFAILKEDESVPSFVSYNFYEVTRENSFDFSLQGILNWTNLKASEEDIEKFVKGGKVEKIIYKGDRYFSFGVYCIGYVNSKMHYVLIFNDITSDVNAKKLLEDSINRADAASKSKTQFLSKMSHEIRTPLNSVIGFSKLALDRWNDSPDEELYDYVNKIQISGNYLLDLVSDILDISRIEEGRMQVNLQPCSLDALVNEIVDSFQGQMTRKNHQFVVDKNYKDIKLNMDSFHTKQILNNLISNACKYTEEGGVVGFEISTKRVDDKKMAVKFVVQDTGIGMSPEFQAKIFEPFTQEERGIRMKNQLRGSGLGMSICKNLVDLQNGTIKLESELGEGSCFTVVLTYEIAADEQSEVISRKTNVNSDYSCLVGKKLLVVDDVEMNRILIEKFLENYGITYDEAEDGQQAVEKFEASAENEYFAIFMDVNMPVMNGHIATETIRKLERKDAKSVVIAGMTADAFSDDVNKALMSGMNYHISKPIQIERVLGVLMETYEKYASDGGKNE